MKTTTPSFLRNGTAGIRPEWLGPWNATMTEVDALRKAIDAEHNPARREWLESQYNAALAKASMANPAGYVPLTFAERVLLEERQRRLPELFRLWLATVDEIMYWTAGDVGPLLDQATEQFQTALHELIAPLAKAHGADLQKAAGAKSLTERIAALDGEIAELRRRLGGLEGKRETLLAEKEKEKPSKIPNAM